MQSNTEISKNASQPLPKIRRGSLRGRGEDRFARSIRRAISSGIVSGELARTFHGWAALWKLPQLQNRVTLCLNARLRTTIARLVIDSSGLEVSTRFFALRDQRQILCHELAHAAAVMKYGRAVRPHGPEWCRLIRMAGFEPQTRRATDRPRGTVPRRAPTPTRYEHRCAVCQAIRYAKRPVKNWRCAECIGAGLGGKLTITSVPGPGAAR
jgi:predicted SprT family Zn-dependent metalloprotease